MTRPENRRKIFVRDKSISIVTRLRVGRLGFDSRKRPGTELPPHHRVQTDSAAHPASYPMATRDSFPDGIVDVSWADHSPPFSVKIENAWNYASSSPYSIMWCLVKHNVFMTWYLVKRRDSFTFILACIMKS